VSVQFTVPGLPAPQGSKTPWGTEANPRTRPWRAAVTAEAAEAMRTRGASLFTGPVLLDVVFSFTRPKSHYGTGRNADRLKPGAPRFHASKPDADKLARAIGDSLTGVVFRDDSQIGRLTVSKVYGDTAGATVLVAPLNNDAIARSAA
jgi:Holliday junction resolvase RusA-like endonuclease